MTHLGIEVQGEKSPSTLKSEGLLRTEMKFAKGQVYTCCISFLLITFTVHKENILGKFIQDMKMNELLFILKGQFQTSSNIFNQHFIYRF